MVNSRQYFMENGDTHKIRFNAIGLYTLVRREVERTIFRVLGQTILSPLVSALLFIFIFGSVLGKRIDLIGNIPYIQFVFPGILTMSVLTAAFLSSSNTVYFQRFIRTIDEMLVAPFSYIEMIIGFIASAIVRALIIAAGILAIGLLFRAVSGAHILLFFFYVLGVAVIFALFGIIIGLWAKGFEQLNVLNTFIIMPLSFLGGMFYSVDLLPSAVQRVVYFNPFFYFIDGVRYAMTGYHESNLAIGATLIIGLIISLGTLVWYLFKISWRLRE